MRTLIAISLLLAAVAAAQGPVQHATSTVNESVVAKLGPQPKQPAKLTNEERLTLENLSLRAALAKAQLERVQEEQQAAVKAICARAGIEPGNCVIDPQTLMIGRREGLTK